MEEQITMRFPANTEYISTVRLAVSGIASKIDFAVDEIEDIKSCVSEACLLILCGQLCDGLEFNIHVDGELRLQVSGIGVRGGECGLCVSDFNEEISRIMIEALSDEVKFDEHDGLIDSITFSKRHPA